MKNVHDTCDNLLFLTALPPPVHGVSYLNNLLIGSNTLKKNFHVSYIKLNYTKSINEVNSFSIQKLFYSIKLPFYIKRRIKTEQHRIVYYSVSSKGFGLFRDFLIVLFTISKSRVQLVLHVRNRDYIDYRKNKLISWLLKKTFNNTHIIQHSSLLREDIAWFVRKPRSWHFVANGIPDQFNKKVLKTDGTKPVILFLSMIAKMKGIEILMKALQVLKNKNVDYHCMLVGGLYDYTIEDFSSLVEAYNIEDNVTYKGSLYQEEKKQIFYQSDLFVFPTQRESFGNVVIEAMCFELPVIASNEGSLPIIVDDGFTGYLFEKNNPYALAEKMEILLKNKVLRTKMGKNGREKYIKNYTFEHFVNNMLDVFNYVSNY